MNHFSEDIRISIKHNCEVRLQIINFDLSLELLTGQKELNSFLMSLIHTLAQGYNARNVISEVYASFVLQCSVSGR